MSNLLFSKSLKTRFSTSIPSKSSTLHRLQNHNLSYLSSISTLNNHNNHKWINNNSLNNKNNNNNNNNNNILTINSKRFAQTLFEKMKEVVPRERDRVKKILSECGDKNLSSVTIQQAFNGMRGVRGIVCETSDIDFYEGIRFRGLNISDVKQRLPTPHCRKLSGHYPMVEGMLWLLLTGEIPTDEEVKQLSEELTTEPRITLPKHVRNCIDNLPVHQHPLTQFAIGILSLQTQSQFAKAYEEGVHRDKYWEFALGMIIFIFYIYFEFRVSLK